MKTFRAAPVLRVSNTEAALKFYREVLGFEVEFQYDDYVGLSMGDVLLHLSFAASGKPSGASAVYVFCDEVDEYFGKIRARGAIAEVDPADRFYAMRDFSICDVDGNRLTFGCSSGKQDCDEV